MGSDFLSSCTSGGCGAKIGPGELSRLLEKLPKMTNEQLLVGYDASDDAAVYAMDSQRAIVSTMDFFPPMVEDPECFGRIAAANALSDVYAMGGEVLFALNMVCFPEKMDKSILAQILEGGASKVQEAGAILCGGHSIYDREIKYGLAVTGQVHPERIWRNNTCKTGDILILTKALGVGIILAAQRVGMAAVEDVADAAASMERLNKYAAEKIRSYHVHACTDVTGFGLLGHVLEMAGTLHTICLYPDQLPVLKGAYEYASEYLLTAGGQRNRNHTKKAVDVQKLDFPVQELMFDPQTSGGLLIAVPPLEADQILADIRTVEPHAMIVGTVLKRGDQAIIFA